LLDILSEQSFVSSNNQLIDVEGCVTQAASQSFTEEGFVTLVTTVLSVAILAPVG